MATLDPPIVNASLVALAICTWLFSRWISARRLKLPPGPRPDPFLGNIRQLSFDYQELRFTEWGALFGIYPSLHLLLYTLILWQATLYTFTSLVAPWSY
jgi:hypothetical protein